MIVPVKPRQHRRDGRPARALVGKGAVTRSSPSSVAVSSPQAAEPIGLGAVHGEETVLVASPSAIGSMPRCQRVERAGMAGLLAREQSLDRADLRGRGQPRRACRARASRGSPCPSAPRRHRSSLVVRIGGRWPRRRSRRLVEAVRRSRTSGANFRSTRRDRRGGSACVGVSDQHAVEPLAASSLRKVLTVAVERRSGDRRTSRSGVRTARHRESARAARPGMRKSSHAQLTHGEAGMLGLAVGHAATLDGQRWRRARAVSARHAADWRWLGAVHRCAFTSSTRKHSMMSPARMSW